MSFLLFYVCGAVAMFLANEVMRFRMRFVAEAMGVTVLTSVVMGLLWVPTLAYMLWTLAQRERR